MEFEDKNENNTQETTRDRTQYPSKESEEEKGSKITTLWALLVSLAASQIVYSNIATFLPPYRT